MTGKKRTYRKAFCFSMKLSVDVFLERASAFIQRFHVKRIGKDAIMQLLWMDCLARDRGMAKEFMAYRHGVPQWISFKSSAVKRMETSMDHEDESVLEIILK